MDISSAVAQLMAVKEENYRTARSLKGLVMKVSQKTLLFCDVYFIGHLMQ